MWNLKAPLLSTESGCYRKYLCQYLHASRTKEDTENTNKFEEVFTCNQCDVNIHQTYKNKTWRRFILQDNIILYLSPWTWIFCKRVKGTFQTRWLQQRRSFSRGENGKPARTWIHCDECELRRRLVLLWTALALFIWEVRPLWLFYLYNLVFIHNREQCLINK